ncbi:cell division protein ZapE [Methylocucumis oryzae]|uniref:cell division protein ZapE n=1 Tax=Methylocucumis oryzae TaxID=1632867 RepID=UPI000B27EAEF|nr:cell division protein ZapE [Methylocucumis oryzae]
MLEVHAFIHQCQQQGQVDAIPLLAEKIKQDLNLLCFDEFHITDIADAMILGRLFSQLFELGVVVVMTSNRHPKDLYQGGLLREQFLFFIKVLQGSAQIVELVADKDYRLDRQPAEQSCYYYPLAPSAEQFALTWFAKLTNNAELTPGFLTVFGRRIALTAVHNKVALTSFDVLCVDALGSADYLALTQQFDYLIVTNIPKLTADKRNEAKRLVTLIDVLYEHKIKLICTAEVSAFDLYLEGDGAFEFRRTVSRLIEMQSRDYFG